VQGGSDRQLTVPHLNIMTVGSNGVVSRFAGFGHGGHPRVVSTAHPANSAGTGRRSAGKGWDDVKRTTSWRSGPDRDVLILEGNGRSGNHRGDDSQERDHQDPRMVQHCRLGMTHPPEASGWRGGSASAPIWCVVDAIPAVPLAPPIGIDALRSSMAWSSFCSLARSAIRSNSPALPGAGDQTAAAGRAPPVDRRPLDHDLPRLVEDESVGRCDGLGFRRSGGIGPLTLTPLGQPQEVCVRAAYWGCQAAAARAGRARC
jgi:hypothetical protein